MGYPENEELYLALSRKELQGLCRKHGLSCSGGKTDLARMLVAHFTRKKAAAKGKTTRRAAGSSKLGPGGASRRTVDTSKKCTSASKEKIGCKGNQVANQALHIIPNGSGHMGAQPFICGTIQNNEILQRPNQQCPGIQKSSEMDISSQNFLNPTNTKNSTATLNCAKGKNLMSGEFCSESDLASSNEAQAEASTSFQFFVRSEEGINLFVDFNTRPTDWINHMKNEVCIYQKRQPQNTGTISDTTGDVRTAKENLNSSCWNRDANNIEEQNGNKRSLAPASGSISADLNECLHKEHQMVSASCTTHSNLHNCSDPGYVFPHVHVETSLQNPADTSSMVKTSNTDA